jgi:hypothetical protein
VSALAATLRRAAAFLDALPEDVPEPSVYAENEDYLALWWQGAGGGLVEVNIHRDGHYECEWKIAGTFGGPGTFGFNGQIVRPEVVEAIRKVIGGGE